MGKPRVTTAEDRTNASGADLECADRDRKASGVQLRRLAVPAARTLTRTVVHVFPNDVDAVSTFVDDLLADGGVRGKVAEELGLALRELLLNAIEHGNLGLTFEDKSAALASGTWKQRVAVRSRTEPYRRRSTRVTAHWARHSVTFTIADEGRGFDWRSLPDPTDPDNLLRDNGRGVLLARMLVDALYYNARGNEVTVVKRL